MRGVFHYLCIVIGNGTDDVVQTETPETKRDMINESKLNEFFPTTMTFGKYEIGLTNFRRNAGHDDSLPYQANVYVNGKRVGEVFNDGWGGISTIVPLNDKGQETIAEVEKYLAENKEKYPMGEPIGSVQLYYDSLDFVCDILAENCDNRKDIKKYYTKRMVCYNPKTKVICTVPYNGIGDRTIPQLLAESPQFRKLWEEGKAKREKEGMVVLNDYEIPKKKIA